MDDRGGTLNTIDFIGLFQKASVGLVMLIVIFALIYVVEYLVANIWK